MNDPKNGTLGKDSRGGPWKGFQLAVLGGQNQCFPVLYSVAPSSGTAPCMASVQILRKLDMGSDVRDGNPIFIGRFAAR